MDSEASVRVFARFRPLNKRELDLGSDRQQSFLKLTDSTVKLPSELLAHEVSFDKVFKPDCTQPEVYEAVAQATVADVLDGYNGTIFAYGQTGAGKSWSMMGPDNLVQMMGVDGFDDSQRGIIPRASAEIFERIFADTADPPTEYSLSVSYLEVYREQIRDLLDPNKNRLEVREHVQKGVYVDGLTEEYVTDIDEVLDVLKRGDTARVIASTKMNAVSSRSHSLFAMTVTQRSAVDGSLTVGKLNLVDLAGSEKLSKTGASGQTLEEAKKINQSLSALGNVIKALSTGEAHVPFRDSKLTRILQSSLGGNTKTALLLACSPHPDNGAETATTLRFGERAKLIKTKVKINQQRSAEELQKDLERLQAELQRLQAYVKTLEGALQAAGVPIPNKITSERGVDAKRACAGDDAENVLLRAKLTEANAQCELLEAEARSALADAAAARAELQPTLDRLEAAVQAQSIAQEEGAKRIEDCRVQMTAERRVADERVAEAEQRAEAIVAAGARANESKLKKQHEQFKTMLSQAKALVAARQKEREEQVKEEKAVMTKRVEALYKGWKERESELITERDAAAAEVAEMKKANLGGVPDDVASQISAADARAACAEIARHEAEGARDNAAAAADKAVAEAAEQADSRVREATERAEAAEREMEEAKLSHAAALNMVEERLAEAEQRALLTEQRAEAKANEDVARVVTEIDELKADNIRNQERALLALRAELQAIFSERCADLETKLEEAERRAEEAEKAAAKSSRVVRPAKNASAIVERTISPQSHFQMSMPEPEDSKMCHPNGAVEHSQVVISPPESTCIKRGATLKMWSNRYIKVDPDSGGLKIYESKRRQTQPCASTIESLTGATITADTRDLAWGGRFYQMTVYRIDLEPPELHFCFKLEKTRDLFMLACTNLSKGEPWDAPASRSLVASPYASKVVVESSREGEQTNDIVEGSTGSVPTHSSACRTLSEELRDGRPAEDGSEADATLWDKQPVDLISSPLRQYALMHVFVNDSPETLTFAGEYLDSGQWWQRPPIEIRPGSTACWCTVGQVGALGQRGTTGCIVYISDAHPKAFGDQHAMCMEVVLAWDNPAIGGQKAGGAVYPRGKIVPTVDKRGNLKDALKAQCKARLAGSAKAPAFDGHYLGWTPPPFKLKLAREPVRCQWIFSIDPDVATRHLRPLLARAGRSTLVTIQNFTRVPLHLQDAKAAYGMFRTDPPASIPAGRPNAPAIVVFASESTGAGTEASVTYLANIPRECGAVLAGAATQATVRLRWINPKINGKRGKWLEVETSFDEAKFATTPGLTVRWDPPEQRDNSAVIFRLEMQIGARPIRYNPASSDFNPAETERYCPLDPPA